MTRSSFSVGGVSLDSLPKWFVNEEQKLHGPQNISRASVTLPFRDGEMDLPRSRSVGAATWEVSITVMGSSYLEFIENKAALEAAFSPVQSLVQIRESIPGDGVRAGRTLMADAQLTSAEVGSPWSSPQDGAELRYTFTIPAGYWYEGPYSQIANGLGTYTHPAAGGSAPKYRSVVTFMATTDRPRFRIQAPGTEDSGVSFYGDGTVTAGDIVTLSTWHPRASGSSGKNYDKMVDTGPIPFYIPVNGEYRITLFSGVANPSVQTYRTWY